MISKENSNYYKKMEVPVRIINNNRGIPNKTPKEKKWGSFKFSPKKASKIFLILLLFLSQAYLLSAFEAHVINVTAHICKPSETRTMGFWKTHPEVYLNCLPQTLGGELINSTTTVDEIFRNANANDMDDQLKAQLLAMKFNICYFITDASEGEEFDGMTLSEIVEAADNLLGDPNATREELEEMKNLLNYLNNLHQIKYCSTGNDNSSGGVSVMLLDEFSVGWVSDYLFVSDNSIDNKQQPETFITAHPESQTSPSEAYFSFASSKRNVTFRCKVNSLDWANCDSPKIYPWLPPGDYQFQVFATDQKGKYDRTPAIFSWTIIEVEQPPAEPPVEPLVEELLLTPEPFCGDGNLDPNEECDDGNTEDGDGCSASCTLEEVLPPITECEPGATTICATGQFGICAAGTQTCNQGGTGTECVQDNEPVSEICNDELDNDCDGYIDCGDEDCLEDENCIQPEPFCGDGNLDPNEECDDGNTEDGDGCSASCTLEEVLPPVTECEPGATTTCATGQFGVCAAGIQTCSSEGFWGECLSDNQPTDEVCDNELDDNCDGNLDCLDSSCAEDEFCLPPSPEEPAGE